jgi:hypothetical protein
LEALDDLDYAFRTMEIAQHFGKIKHPGMQLLMIFAGNAQQARARLSRSAALNSMTKVINRARDGDEIPLRTRACESL